MNGVCDTYNIEGAFKEEGIETTSSLKTQVSFAKEPYKRNHMLVTQPIRRLLENTSLF